MDVAAAITGCRAGSSEIGGLPMTTWVARDKSFVDGPELPEIWYDQKTSTEKQLDLAETSLYLHLEDKSLSFKQKSEFDNFFSYQIELGGPSRGNLHARISIERCVGVKRKGEKKREMEE